MIVFDAEMAGLDPERSSIVSIGAVDFQMPSRQFYQECRVWDGAEINPAALAINGFTSEQVVDPSRPPLEQTIRAFIDWIRQSTDQTLAGQNVAFDCEFIKASVRRYQIDWRSGYRVVDLHSVCWAHMLHAGMTPPLKDGRTNLNLDGILTYVGLPEEPKPHNALTGAVMEAEAFSRLIYGTNLLSEFATHPVPEHLLQ